MFSWGKYVADTINTVAQEVTQFSQEAIESVVGEEEEVDEVHGKKDEQDEDGDPIRRQLRQLAQNSRDESVQSGTVDEQKSDVPPRESAQNDDRYVGVSSTGEKSVPISKAGNTIAKKSKKGKFSATKIEDQSNCKKKDSSCSEQSVKEAIIEKQQSESIPAKRSAEQHPSIEGEEESSWVPHELKFASAQPQNILNFGKSLIESGAGLALGVLPGVEQEESANEKEKPTGAARSSDAPSLVTGVVTDEPSPDTGNVATTSTTPAVVRSSITPAPSTTIPAASAATRSRQEPLELLRLARGKAELKKRRLQTKDPALVSATAVVASQEFIEKILSPAQFSTMDVDGKVLARCHWVADTAVGRQIRLTREHCTTLENEETGLRCEGQELFAKLSDFPKMVEDVAVGVASNLTEELASTFASGKPSMDCEWFSHNMKDSKRCVLSEEDEKRVDEIAVLAVNEDTRKEEGGDGKGGESSSNSIDVRLLAKNVTIARNVAALVFFGLREIQEAATTLRDESHACFVWSKKTRQENTSQVKERATKVRQECYTAAASSVAQISEAVECVISLFPPVIGTGKKKSGAVVSSANEKRSTASSSPASQQKEEEEVM